jgi:hypothetical protein
MLEIFKRAIYRSLVLSLIVGLSGCSIYKGQFDCAAKKGIGCESVSKVNELIDDDELDEFTEGVNGSGKKGSKKSVNKFGTKGGGGCNCGREDCGDNLSSTSSTSGTASGSSPTSGVAEKMTIHFNEYQEKGIKHKESEIEVYLDGK